MPLPPNLRIFDPLTKTRQGGTLYTWNIGDADDMRPLLIAMRVARRWEIVVGYSKDTHSPGRLINVSREWQRICPGIKQFRFLPGMHIKAWDLGTGLWVGSTNLLTSTISNCMVKISADTTPYFRTDVLRHVQGYALRHGTDLMKLPTAKDRHVNSPERIVAHL